MEEIKNEPYTIKEALNALDTPVNTMLRITASKEEKRKALIEMLVYLNISTKWAIEHLISLQD